MLWFLSYHYLGCESYLFSSIRSSPFPISPNALVPTNIHPPAHVTSTARGANQRHTLAQNVATKHSHRVKYHVQCLRHKLPGASWSHLDWTSLVSRRRRGRLWGLLCPYKIDRQVGVNASITQTLPHGIQQLVNLRLLHAKFHKRPGCHGDGKVHDDLAEIASNGSEMRISRPVTYWHVEYFCLDVDESLGLQVLG